MNFISMKSPVGDLTLFEDNDAIVAVQFGRAPGGRKTDLLARCETQLREYFAGKRKKFDLPLRPTGTRFQCTTWKQMSKIPYGRTQTYGEIAKQINSAARAVGGACGRNPVPIIIPCHRVVGAGGWPGGYSGGDGLDTKHRLLHLEGVELI